MGVISGLREMIRWSKAFHLSDADTDVTLLHFLEKGEVPFIFTADDAESVSFSTFKEIISGAPREKFGHVGRE
jgi:hypothetical protein